MKLDGFDQEWLTTCTLMIPGQASPRQDEAHDVVAVCEKSTIFGRAKNVLITHFDCHHDRQALLL